jgi:hypothetical protein
METDPLKQLTDLCEPDGFACKGAVEKAEA